MLKNILSAALLSLMAFALNAQSAFDYANGWYDANLSYVKVNVWEDGVYRVSATDLSSMGMSVSPTDVNNLQLFYRGEEQHLFVKTTSGNLDYIEFYGLRNDGRVDSIMYREPYSHLHSPDQQPNKHISLWSDTSAYFLTIANTPGLRYTDFNDTNFGNYTPEPHFPYYSLVEFHPSSGIPWNLGGGATYDIFQVLNSYYITGEGYVGPNLSYGTAIFQNIPTEHAANLGNPSQLAFRVYGKSNWRHILQVSLDGTPYFRDTTANIYIKTRLVPYNVPLGNQLNVRFEALGDQNGNTDNNNICWLALKYDRLFNMSGAESITVSDWLKQGNSYFQFTNSDTTTTAVAYDLVTHTRSVGVGSGTNVQVVVPGSNQIRQIVIATDKSYKTPTLSAPILANHSDVNSGASFVIITHKSLAASAQAYKAYRDTCSVNPLTAKVVYLDEIYDEFGSGSPTPLAIKRFCKYAIDNWTETPRYFLLWGKGQYIIRDHPLNLVPTYSYPANDYDFVSDFDNFATNLVPEAAIGRVNIYNDAEGFIYLNKVKHYEYEPFTAWMKQAVYLGGGNDTLEQKPIFNYLERFRSIFEGTPFGGTVNYYQKFNTGQITNSTMGATDRINAGVSLINFFGHSSNNIYDVDIREPSLYLNFDKYPFMLAFGCYGGNYTGNAPSFGERFVLAEGRGSIGYLANSTAGYLTPLGNFGEHFYASAYRDFYGERIGDQIIEALRSYTSVWSDQVYINHAKQMNLQGDPAIHLHQPIKPDLEITASSIFFEPYNFSASDSSFDINVVTTNNGLATQDSFYMSIRQQTPQGTWIVHPMKKYGPVTRSDTLTYTIENTIGAQMAGLNNFDVFVDSTDALDEYREDNNRVIHNVVIPGNVPAILYPYDYAVVEAPEVTLSASTLIMSQLRNVRYLYEIDTVPTFNSPRYTSSPVMIGTSNYSEWSVPFALTDSMVYYWRVRLADIQPDAWAKASFKYIASREGWAQSRPPQFFEDGTYRLQMNTTSYEWEFDKWSVDLHAYSHPNDHAIYRLANGAFFSIVPGNNNLNGLMYTPIRAKDLQPAITSTVNGDWAYTAMPDGGNIIVATIASLEKGDYFLAVSERNPKVEQWSPQVRSAFSMIGCDTTLLNSFTPGNSLIVLGRKGYPGQGIILSSPNLFDQQSGTWNTDLARSLNSTFAAGTVSSTTVGPASSWNDLIWKWNSADPFVEEDTRVDLYVSHDGLTDSLVFQNLTAGSYSLTGIDADKYPFIKLKAAMGDSAFLTAPQLDNWHVLYDPAPDVVIDPISVWSFDRDSVVQGESISIKYAATNISESDMDSLLVRYMVQLPDRRTVEVGRHRFAPIAAGQTLEHSYTFSTNFPDMVGDLALTIELNPENDQAEQYHFNNLFTHAFHVQPDQINPILDVTVDGKHLMEGDIVSPLPEILVQINDENHHLAVPDTAFELYFGRKSPNPANLPRVFMNGNSEIQIETATLPDNKVKLHFRPGRLEDGEYTLRVQGTDFSGNEAGKSAYEINFKVVNEVAVSNLLNYPNPFSTSTRFVYTMTGAEIPETFEIHIFTITGKLVKIIDLHETNDVRVGYTMTRYAWDGRDEYGDLLANGVYLYKVVAKVNGKSMDIRDEGITDLFKNGYGKMYLMR